MLHSGKRCTQVSRDLCDSGLHAGHRPANHITMRAKRWPADSEIKRRGKARLISLKGKLRETLLLHSCSKRPVFPGLGHLGVLGGSGWLRSIVLSCPMLGPLELLRPDLFLLMKKIDITFLPPPPPPKNNAF